MRNIKLICEYDGTSYSGFQRQAQGIPTIQGTLEAKIKEITGKEVNIIGSGRTDAGVHALGQVVNFKIDSSIPSDRFAPALNSVLPNDIRIISSEEVSLDFHSRFDAKSKIYKYFILNRPVPTAILRTMAYYVPYKLDLGQMKAAARFLIGNHDFSSFTAANSGRKDFTRNVMELTCNYENNEVLSITVKADGFLYNMVRNIVGTLVEVGKGKLKPEEIPVILEARNRALAGPTAPPHGLFLIKVEYCT